MDIKHLNPKAQKIIIGNKYILKERLGGGSFGQIYLASDSADSSATFAIKLEKRVQNGYTTLQKEAKIISDLKDTIGFPTLYDAGKEEEYNYMALNLLGFNLEKLFKLCHYRFSLKTVLMLANQMLSRIEILHNKGYVHRDIKPENFCMGTGQFRKTLFLIDFGLARSYKDANGKHIPYKDNKGLVGTARYASINAHMGGELSRRDDLEEIGYTLIYLLKGSLPWQNLKGQTKNEKYQFIKDRKMNIPIETLCRGIPNEFVIYMTCVRGLGFTDTPNYKYLKNLFRNLLAHSGFELDYQYDWLCKLNPATLKKEVNGQPPKIPIKDASVPDDSRNNSPIISEGKANVIPRWGFREQAEVAIKLRPTGVTFDRLEDDESPKTKKLNKVVQIVGQKFMSHLKQKSSRSRSKSMRRQSRFDCTTSYHSSKVLNFTIVNAEDDIPIEVEDDESPGDKIELTASLVAKRKDFSQGAISAVFASGDSLDLPEGLSGLAGLANSKKPSASPKSEPTSAVFKNTSSYFKKSGFHQGKFNTEGYGKNKIFWFDLNICIENLSESAITEWRDGQNLSKMLLKQQYNM